MLDEVSHTARNSWHQVLVFIRLNSLIWWAAFSISRHYLDGSDMVENYAWGMNWQWGTNKHPPLFGWIAAAWFTLFPTTDWAYYLLNEFNLGAAFVLLALALRRVLYPRQVFVALALTALATCFGADSGYKYNADTGQLPFIAGFLWAVLVATQERRSGYYLLAGVFAAAAVLTKYYALVLLLAIGLSIRLCLRPRFPDLVLGGMLAGLVCLAFVSPHLFWAAQHGWPTLHYMRAAHLAQAPQAGVHAFLEILMRALLFGALTLVIWRIAFTRLPGSADLPLEDRIPRLGLSIFILSLVLTLIASWIENLELTAHWLIPAFLFLGWALVDLTPPTINWGHCMRRMQGMTLFWWGLVLTGAVVYEARYRDYPAPPPYALSQQIAEDVTQLYHQTYHQPIRYAAGSFPYPYVLSFYSPDHPKGLDGLNLSSSFWIDRQKLMGETKVVVCIQELFQIVEDPFCDLDAKHLLGKPDKSVILNYSVYDPKRRRVGIQRFNVLMYPPLKPMEHTI